MPKIEITSRNKKQLVKMCKIYEDIFYVKERKNPPKDEQWTMDDLSDMVETGRKIISVLKKYFYRGKIKV
ncbi:MAG: hypothetical protein HY919_04690 [Elusimicrobia bacterium]|nr:hypothetical protein [Elusimicrobiota bacterium]